MPIEAISTTCAGESSNACLPPSGGSAVVLLPHAAGIEPGSHVPLPTNDVRTHPGRSISNPLARGSSISVEMRVPSNVGDCLAAALDSRWLTYRKQLRKCQKDFSAEAVHQLRVATRRLMTQYGLLSFITPGDQAGKARRKLKRHLKLLGELRDTQVHRMFFEDHAIRFPELGLLFDELQRRERRLIKAVAVTVQRLGTRKLERWTSDFCQVLRTGADQPPDQLAGKVFEATTNAFAEVVRLRLAITPSDARTIHSTRVAFKKFRYLVEALSPEFTGFGKRQLRRFANYQRRMGDLQDLEMLEAFVTGFVREHPETADHLRPFRRNLRSRHARKLHSVLKHADDLFGLWNPTRRDQRDDAPVVAASRISIAA